MGIDYIAVEQFEFEVHVIEDGDFFFARALFYFFIKVEVFALVIGEELFVHVEVFPGEIDESGELVFETHEVAEGFYKFEFLFFVLQVIDAGDGGGYGH